ncbi:MAG: sugar ABC transporter permease [Anaerolinea sp.]|nr:sugar ABC transporter permease [Anaerolinea sp.]
MIALSPARTLTIRQREIRWGYFFLSPWIIGFLCFSLFPMVASLFLSFTNYSPDGTAYNWIGIDNYSRALGLEARPYADGQAPQEALTRGYDLIAEIGGYAIGARDPIFWKSLSVTISYAALALPIGMIAGLLFAVLMNQKIPGIRLFRTIFYLPSVLPGVATAVIFIYFLNRDGWLNSILESIGFQPLNWLNTPELALPTLVIISLWGVGGGMILYLAAFQGVPTELYEAAKVDGASLFIRFARITLPMISPVIFFNLIMGLIGTFQYFGMSYILFGPTGGNDYSAYFYNMNLYRQAFSYLDMGYASALAWILLVIVVGITLIVFKTSGQWVFYAGGRER